MTKDKLSPYLYLLPGLVIIAIFIYYPIFENVIDSFYQVDPLSNKRDFLGVLNYTNLFTDKVFYTALMNNTLYAFISMVLQVFGGLVLAAILEDKVFRRISPFLRTVYFIPVLISMTVIGFLFNFIYHPDIGLLNQMLRLIGLDSLAKGWLGDSSTAIYAIIAISQWQSIGYTIMLYVVVIQKIPQEIYEAARIDGATKIQSFFNVTLPQVKEMMFVASVYTISGSYLVFSEVYVTTNGGPGYSTQVLSTYLYQSAFVTNEMGYASAIANVVLLITILLFFIQKRVYRTGEEG